MARPRAAVPRTKVANVRLTDGERQDMERAAGDLGIHGISEYIRHLHQRHVAAARPPDPVYPAYPAPREHFASPYGTIYHGDSLGLLSTTLQPKSVDLIMTSPPFGLVRKKSYGNEAAEKYLEWFRPFARGFKRVLKDSGSIVIDIGGAWKPGTPTRSLYHYELLVMLCREYGFHLCEEHYWWNPAKLPTPAEWVNVRRIRVKDAVNCVWWLSPTPWPKASNKRVLAPYSDSMHLLLKNGYKPALRPSGHDISDKFGRDNGGAVPPNLLAVANTESNGRYQEYCRKNDLPVHPARYPAGVPEYFIRFLTDPGDLVVDPFAGSCVTGEVCERLRRSWMCCDSVKAYLDGALARFQPDTAPAKRRPEDARAPECKCPACSHKLEADWIKAQAKRFTPDSYSIPAAVARPVDEVSAPLIKDGGQKRPEFIKKPTPRGPVPLSPSSGPISSDKAVAPIA